MYNKNQFIRLVRERECVCVSVMRSIVIPLRFLIVVVIIRLVLSLWV